jgi:hypothetical protein
MDYSLRERWCLAVGAPVIMELGRDPRELGGWSGIARSKGEWEVHQHTTAELRNGYGITTRDELIAWTRGLLHGKDPRAFDLARVVAVVGAAVGAQLMTEEDAWHVILVAGKVAQQAYRSWDELAAGYVRAGGGRPLDDPALLALWSELPWDTELGVTVVDPRAGAKARVLRSSCPSCSAPRVRASPTAYVYCDYCGQLMDYDLMVALEKPAERPGPAYEALATGLAPELHAARDRGDADGYRAIQQRLFDAWVVACPSAVPVRVKDSAYRAAIVGWLAKAQTVAAFDAEARTTEAAMTAATARVQFFALDNGKLRVPSDQFGALADAMFAYEARRDELFVQAGVYDLHPDGARRELQRRIGFSMFVHGWLPMIDEEQARMLLERTGLEREYAIVDPPERHTAACARCGGVLDLVAGARRVLCEHCGRLVDVIGR